MWHIFCWNFTLMIIWYFSGVFSLLSHSVAKPLALGDGAAGLIIACLDMNCDQDAGPVCGIDASGMTRTFENRCFANLAYCNEGRCKWAMLHGHIRVRIGSALHQMATPNFNLFNIFLFVFLDYAVVSEGEC